MLNEKNYKRKSVRTGGGYKVTFEKIESEKGYESNTPIEITPEDNNIKNLSPEQLEDIFECFK